MVRRLVNGFVRDPLPPQLHMFQAEADKAQKISTSLSRAQETQENVSFSEHPRRP